MGGVPLAGGGSFVMISSVMSLLNLLLLLAMCVCCVAGVFRRRRRKNNDYAESISSRSSGSTIFPHIGHEDPEVLKRYNSIRSKITYGIGTEESWDDFRL